MQDFNLKEGDPVVDNEEQLIWQQIDILFDTMPGVLHGDQDYGTDYEHFLFELNSSPDDLEYKMTRDLNQLDLFSYDPEVTVNLYKGTQRDIALINVELTTANKKIVKRYKIS